MGRIAFVAGSNGSQEFDRLHYAESDANAIASAFSDIRCQFHVARPNQGASPYEFRETLDKAAASCNTEDTFVVYFAGHGVLDAGELFLILDSTTSNFQTTALPAEDVLASMRRCKARNKLLILDCCHAGGVIRYRDTGSLPVEELRIASANHLILMSSGRLERAREYDSLKGGFLAHKICAALGAQFHEADTNRDLCLTVDELMDFLESAASWHNKYADPNEKVPVPYLFGEKKGELFLTLEKPPWNCHEIQWADETVMTILPIPPVPLMFWGRRFAADFDIDDLNSKRNGGLYAFAIGKHPITNHQYQNFLEQGGAKTPWSSRSIGEPQPIRLRPGEPQGENFNHEVHKWIGSFHPWDDERFNHPLKPVVCVSFDEALAYSRWAHELASSELPGSFTNLVPYTLWDFAAFGTEYPSRDPMLWISNLGNAHHKTSEPSEIDLHGERSNKKGITDLLGNVWEWCGSMSGFLNRCGFEHHRFEREKICLRGGGFLDDLEKVSPFLDESEIPDRARSHHSDHGFRIAALVPFELLPIETQKQLELFPSLQLEHRIEISFLAGEANDF
jgi:formylglycine-generating enzyme required for sulfatase activity